MGACGRWGERVEECVYGPLPACGMRRLRLLSSAAATDWAKACVSRGPHSLKFNGIQTHGRDPSGPGRDTNAICVGEEGAKTRRLGLPMSDGT